MFFFHYSMDEIPSPLYNESRQIQKDYRKGAPYQNVIIKQTILGRGMPKICAPLVEKDYESLIHQAASFTEQPVDIAEWRADWFDSILEPDTLDQVLPGLESALKDIPLLFTFRTQREGGHLSAPLPAYRSLAEHAICSGHVHLVDLELFSGDDMIRETIVLAHRHQVSVILSNHDFAATPKEEEILRRLHHMEDLGADIAKIAVMPQSAGDVLTLLSATHKASALKEGLIPRVPTRPASPCPVRSSPCP